MILQSSRLCIDFEEAGFAIAQFLKIIFQDARVPLVVDSHQLYITTSIGLAICPQGGEEGHILIKNADIAMYDAKEKGRDNYQRYLSHMNYKGLASKK